jgi:hypothetical protein
MAKDGRKPRYNVISLRMTDEEMESIQQLMALTNTSASTIMRHAFTMLSAQWADTRPEQADAPQAG